MSRLGQRGEVRRVDGRIELALRGAEVDVGGAPEGSVVVVTVAAGRERVRLASEARGDPPSWLTAATPATCTSLVFDQSPGRRATVMPAGQALEISFAEKRVGALRIIGHGRVSLAGAASVAMLDLEQAGGPLEIVIPEGVHMTSVAVKGSVRLTGVPLRTECLRLRGAAHVHLDVPLHAARLRLGREAPIVAGDAPLEADEVDPGGAIELSTATVALGCEKAELPALAIRGSGTIEARGGAAGLAITPADDRQPITLKADMAAHLRDVSGTAVLRAAPRSVVVGSEDGSFSPAAVRVAERAVIQHINPARLRSLDDLARLAEANRVTFTLPRRTAAACRLADGMAVEARPGAPTGSATVQFWEQAAELLNKNKASSASQSMARYLAARARRRTSRPRLGRERILYSLYGLVGYGERIVQPMLVYVVLAFLLAWRISVDALGVVWPWDVGSAELETLATKWSLVLQSPLAFFEFGTRRVPRNALDQLLLVAFQVVGLVLIGVSLLAVRRTVAVGNLFGD